MVTPHLPWKFHANRFRGLLVMLLTKKLASQHRTVSPNWPKSESCRPMVTPHLSWKFHANRPSRLLVMLTNDVKEISVVASRGFSDLTQNLIRLSHGHSAPSLKISCKSVQLFSRNLANKETNKQRYKEIDWKQYPIPRYIGDFNNLKIWPFYEWALWNEPIASRKSTSWVFLVEISCSCH